MDKEFHRRSFDMNLFTKVSGAVLMLGLIIVVANGQEKKITRKQLPPAVEKTVARESEGATIKGFATEVEKGQRLYEAELIVNGHHKDISMNRRGAIVEVEEEVSMDSLPATVQDGLRKDAGSGTNGR